MLFPENVLDVGHFVDASVLSLQIEVITWRTITLDDVSLNGGFQLQYERLTH